MPARLSPAVRDHRNDCPEIDWIECPQVALNLHIEWLETGGPPLEMPSNSGYGRRVITELVPYELGGTADLVFLPEGIQYRLEIPAEWWALVPNKSKVKSPTKDESARHERK
jgi:two-component sensor histidine kinase